jgi:hypothetical protein
MSEAVSAMECTSTETRDSNVEKDAIERAAPSCKTQEPCHHFMKRFQLWDEEDWEWVPYDPSSYIPPPPEVQDDYNYFYLNVRWKSPAGIDSQIKSAGSFFNRLHSRTHLCALKVESTFARFFPVRSYPICFYAVSSLIMFCRSYIGDDFFSDDCERSVRSFFKYILELKAKLIEIQNACADKFSPEERLKSAKDAGSKLVEGVTWFH